MRTPRPTVLPQLQGVDLQTRYYSARTGGDFFDAISLPPYLIFLLTDIAGLRAHAHPIAARLQDALYQDAPRLFNASKGINMTDAIAALAHALNHAILQVANEPATPAANPSEAHHGTVFSPTFLGCFDTSLGILAYINAGGLPALFRDRDGSRPLGNATMPLGLFTHLTFEPAVQAFEPGARLLLTTRGIAAAQRGRTAFGMERLSRILDDSSTSALELAETVVQQAHAFQSPRWRLLQPFLKPKPSDDLTALVLHRPSL